jgi:hypothetical protein
MGMTLCIPTGLNKEIKDRLKRNRIEKFSIYSGITIPTEFEAEVHYYLYGENGRVQNFLFDRYVLIERSPEGRKKYTIPNRDIPDYISKMIKDRKLIAHLHSHPSKSCITRLENLGVHPSIYMKHLEYTGQEACQPSLQCFSDKDLEARALDGFDFEISDKTQFVEVLYCEPQEKYVGFYPLDKRMAEIVIY